MEKDFVNPSQEVTRLLPKKILKGPSELNAENLGAQHMKWKELLWKIKAPRAILWEPQATRAPVRQQPWVLDRWQRINANKNLWWRCQCNCNKLMEREQKEGEVKWPCKKKIGNLLKNKTKVVTVMVCKVLSRFRVSKGKRQLRIKLYYWSRKQETVWHLKARITTQNAWHFREQ